MKEYEINARVTISISTKVLADTEEEALKIAANRADILNAQYENPDEYESWVAYEYDGVPSNLSIEKCLAD